MTNRRAWATWDVMPTSALFFGHEIYRNSSYGEKHPLSIPRVSTCIDLCRAMGWLEDGAYVDSRQATDDDMARFHCPDYLAALARAEREGRVDGETRARHNIGNFENPVFPEIYRRPAVSAGAGIDAARRLLAEDRRAVYSPASGTHHAMRDRARGFCFVNAPVLAICALLDAGAAPVFYVDLDAHHGDGVEAAFFDDPRVWTLSIHQAGLWPRTGEAGRAGAEGTAINLPVPIGFNDDELAYLIDCVVLPLMTRARPAVLVLQTGADALADDPLSRLELSNRGLWAAVRALLDAAPRALVVGGGGYNPWSVGRAWAGVWATVSGVDPAEAALTDEARAVLAGLRWSRAAGRNPPARWLETLADPPRPGPLRDEVRALAAVAAGRYY